MWLSLAWSSLLNRKLSVFLTLIALLVSMSLLFSIEHIRVQSQENFKRTVSGIDVVVAARSSQINVLLSSIFRIGANPNGVSWETYQTIGMSPKVVWTVPLSLGDSYKGFAVVGTTPDYFKHYRFANKQELTLTQGRFFAAPNEAVVGANVAKHLNLQLGQEVIVAHGSGEVSFTHHADNPMMISGILAATGTPVDDSVHVPLIAIENMHQSGDHQHHDHGEHSHDAHDHEEHDHSAHKHDEHEHDHEGHDHDEHDHDAHDHEEHDHSAHKHDEHEHDHEGHEHDEHDHDAHEEHDHSAHKHDEHAHEHEEHDHSAHKHDEHEHDHEGHDHGEHDHDAHDHDSHDSNSKVNVVPDIKPGEFDLIGNPTSISAFLIKADSPFDILTLQRDINKYEGEALSAILPQVALSELWKIIGSVESLLQVIAILVLVSSLIGLATMQLSSMQQRQAEISVFRAVGASPWFIASLIQAEALLLSALAIVLAYGLVSVSLYLAGDYLLSNYGVLIDGNIFSSGILYYSLAALVLTLIISILPTLSAYRRAKFLFR